jgi:hypothetical protein
MRDRFHSAAALARALLLTESHVGYRFAAE